MKKLLFVFFITLISCTNNFKQANYYFIKGLNDYEKENKVSALKNYQKAYDLDKKNIKIVREIAYLYANLGDVEKAEEFYKKALQLDPHDENSLENLLKILYTKKDIENIEKYSNQILDKNSLLYKHSQLKLKNLKNK
ncbi:MAG: tetratricopeptide repeat protein [Fusobacterium sp.]|nr:tetratricopeptide repeat protein [Fusobacterium sp.]